MLKYILIICILIGNLFANHITLTNEERQWVNNNTVKIGTEVWKPIVYLDNSTNLLSGIIGDILNIGFKNLNIKTTITSDKWNVVLDNFKKNKIDLIPAIYYTEERAKFANYSDKIFSLHEYLYIKENSDIKNFEDLKYKKLAIIKSYAMIKMLKEKFPFIEIVETNNLKESVELVLNGKVDALIDGQLVLEDFISSNLVLGLKGIRQSSFEANDIYLITSKSTPLLQSIFNKALGSISEHQKNQIAKKWLNIKDPLFFLKLNEKKYISKNKVIRMCNNPTWEPIEFLASKQQGDMQGIAIDTLHLIEDKLSVKFVHVATKSWKESQEFLRDKKCDILPAAVQTKQRLKYANFTIPYLTLPLAIFTQKNKPLITDLHALINTKTWSRKKGSGLINKIKNKYHNTKVIETKDNVEALRLVNDGKVDFTIATLPFASNAMTKYQFNNLQISGYTDISFDLSIAVRNDNKVLLRILNKSLKQLSSDQKQEITKKWLYSQNKDTFNSQLFFKILLFITIIAFILIYKQYSLKKSNKQLKLAVAEKTQELQNINNNLEKSIKIEIQKASRIEKKLHESEKMVAMGEMISNIAHHWRQPLSVITTTATGLIVQKEYNILNDDKLIKNLNEINSSAQFLSKTIDDFKDLIKTDLDLEYFNLTDIINKTIYDKRETFNKNNINIILELDNSIRLQSYSTTLIQSIKNIINNCEDALLSNDIEDKYIFINTFVNNNTVIIEIYDNAKGIDKDNIARIFEAYFTTKHKSLGTGLGLHITYNMIVSSLKGNVTAENFDYSYNNNQYTGAKLTISLNVIEK